MARTKEQMQLLVLAVLAGCAGVVVLVMFVFMPMFDRLNGARAELEGMSERLNEIRRTVRDRSVVQEQADRTIEALREASSRIPLPVLGNYMIGMEESVLGCIDKNAVDVSAFVSAGEPANLAGGSGVFKVFQTRCVATSGLHDLASAFHAIEESFPYASISGVTISPQDETPERHMVTFVVSWLIWSDPQTRPLLAGREK